MDLLENRSLDEIKAFFADRGLPVRVHRVPPTPSRDELRRMPRLVRQTYKREQPAIWAALGQVARWYGSGDSEEEAVRSAARRFRIEQIGVDNPRRPGDPLP